MSTKIHEMDWTKCEWTHSRPGIKFVTFRDCESMTTILREVTTGHESEATLSQVGTVGLHSAGRVRFHGCFHAETSRTPGSGE